MKTYVLKPSTSYQASAHASGSYAIQHRINAAYVQKAIRRKYGEDGLQRTLEASRKWSMGQHWIQKRRAQQGAFWLLVEAYALFILVVLVSGAAKLPG